MLWANLEYSDLKQKYEPGYLYFIKIFYKPPAVGE